MTKKIKSFYYINKDKNEVVHIDYNELFHDYYSKTGKFRRLLGGSNDRIEAYLICKNYTKITKSQFDKAVDEITR